MEIGCVSKRPFWIFNFDNFTISYYLARKFLQTVVYCAVNVPHYQEPQKYDICVFVAWKV